MFLECRNRVGLVEQKDNSRSTVRQPNFPTACIFLWGASQPSHMEATSASTSPITGGQEGRKPRKVRSTRHSVPRWVRVLAAWTNGATLRSAASNQRSAEMARVAEARPDMTGGPETGRRDTLFFVSNQGAHWILLVSFREQPKDTVVTVIHLF